MFGTDVFDKDVFDKDVLDKDVLDVGVLDDDTIARYARQIVVPGIGAAGQKKLLSSTVLLLGNERGCNQAQLYLRAAGVRVVRPAAPSGDLVRSTAPNGSEDTDLVVVADAATLDERTYRALVECSRPICWYVVEEDAFTAGVHPAAALPRPRTGSTASSAQRFSALHDAAACDVASVACAILIGLEVHGGPFRLEG